MQRHGCVPASSPPQRIWVDSVKFFGLLIERFQLLKERRLLLHRNVLRAEIPAGRLEESSI